MTARDQRGLSATGGDCQRPAERLSATDRYRRKGLLVSTPEVSRPRRCGDRCLRVAYRTLM
ncbi:MAG: hypothetical protein JO115_09800 [Pseudonocardiales bacterium]|nr:hypothetical protein [Pseudonocardiales bacterium]